MKSLRLILSVMLLLAPVFLFSQDLSGVWTGRLSNDSLNTRKDQTYELALTEYRGKVYGYSYTTFIYNDTLYYIVKRVKGKIEDDVCEVEDDEIVAHNFFGRLDKKVKVTQTFRMNKADSTWHLEGKWKTNKTKEFYALTGGIALQQEKDFEKSRLLQHLGDLKLDKQLTFYQPEEKYYLPSPRRYVVRKDEPVIARTDPSKKRVETNSGVGTLEIKNPEPERKPEPDVVLTKQVQTATTNQPVIAKADPSAKKVDTNSGVGVLEIKNPEPERKPDVVLNKPVQTAITTEKIQPPAIRSENIQTRNIAVTLTNPEFEERKKNIIQTVTYKSDSLILSLYDNGEVDGDTVSVFVNGEEFLFKQGLKSSAIKKTVYLAGDQYEEVEILLYADNLGKYPPNTGLLIIRDGDDRYEIRFSADFEQSAAIILRRKRN